MKQKTQQSIMTKTKVMTVVWLEAILRNFPNAVEGQKLTVDISDYLQRIHGLTRENTLFGFSTCADEINRTVTQFRTHYGEKQFPLGGLTGYPFRGKTGFVAFLHHTPNHGAEGNVIILYGPHVGVTYEGELGKVLREGQSHESAACGAALSFLNKYLEAKKSKQTYQPKKDHLDMEQYAFERMILPYADDILRADKPVKKLVEINYELIDGAVRDIIKERKNNFNGKIALVGGIMINTPHLQPSYFDLRRFQIYLNGKVTDLLLELENATRHQTNKK